MYPIWISPWKTILVEYQNLFYLLYLETNDVLEIVYYYLKCGVRINKLATILISAQNLVI